MSNFLDSGSGSTLQDVLGAQADTQARGVTEQYAKKKRKDAAMAASSGRLNSGVHNYTVGDTASAELGDLGNVYGGLADALGQIPQNDYLTEEENRRYMELAKLIGDEMQSGGGALGGVMGGLSGGMSGVASGSVFGPPGMIVGGVLGAGMGAYGGSKKRAY